MERQHIAVRGLEEIGPQPMDDGVGDFVRNDVMREAGEDRLAGKVLTRRLSVGAEIAKEDGVELGVEERVSTEEGVGEQPEYRAGIAAIKCDRTAKCSSGAIDDLRRNGVDHLLVKSGVRLTRRQTSLHQQCRVI